MNHERDAATHRQREREQQQQQLSSVVWVALVRSDDGAAIPIGIGEVVFAPADECRRSARCVDPASNSAPLGSTDSTDDVDEEWARLVQRGRTVDARPRGKSNRAHRAAGVEGAETHAPLGVYFVDEQGHVVGETVTQTLAHLALGVCPNDDACSGATRKEAERCLDARLAGDPGAPAMYFSAESTPDMIPWSDYRDGHVPRHLVPPVLMALLTPADLQREPGAAIATTDGASIADPHDREHVERGSGQTRARVPDDAPASFCGDFGTAAASKEHAPTDVPVPNAMAIAALLHDESAVIGARLEQSTPSAGASVGKPFEVGPTPFRADPPDGKRQTLSKGCAADQAPSEEESTAPKDVATGASTFDEMVPNASIPTGTPTSNGAPDAIVSETPVPATMPVSMNGPDDVEPREQPVSTRASLSESMEQPCVSTTRDMAMPVQAVPDVAVPHHSQVPMRESVPQAACIEQVHPEAGEPGQNDCDVEGMRQRVKTLEAQILVLEHQFLRFMRLKYVCTRCKCLDSRAMASLESTLSVSEGASLPRAHAAESDGDAPTESKARRETTESAGPSLDESFVVTDCDSP